MVMAGLERPDSGEVVVNGTSFNALDEDGLARFRGRHVGIVFQSFHLIPTMTALENVAVPLELAGHADPAGRAARELEAVGLGARLHHYPTQLSGGEQQRVALARALAPRPQLMLLDEPFSNLDVDLRERLAHEVRAILKAAGATALFVTHDQLEAFAIGDRIGVMQAGQLHQWDDAYALYHRPATRFVADFIGHGVFAPATLVQQGDNVVARTPLGDLTDLAECPLPGSYPGGECDVLLRADDVVHDDAAPVQARITRKSFRGSEFLYTLELANGLTVMAHVPSHHDHAVGEWIGIRPQVDHVVAFAREAAPGPLSIT
jgi:iron(III) transport system ATP-binding protein